MATESTRALHDAGGHHRFRLLISSCRERPPLRMGIIHPCDALSLHGALEATALGLIEPVLFGPEKRIREVAAEIDRSLDGIAIHASPTPSAAALYAAEAVKHGRVAALMKGDIHTSDMMHALLAPESRLRTAKRMSHAFAIDVPGYAHPLIVSDAALNVRPGLDEKRAICQNAIDLAVAIGIRHPKVAVLAAVETIHAAMPATVDAAALAKMAERGQITGASVDGPLALDDAIRADAARAKHLDSVVAGRANVLIVPDLEAGNVLAKELVLLADGIAAGIVMGAAVPIALGSRADGAAARVASAALAVLTAPAPLHGG
ncbi:bifunctional enoyl-CoA hydratase/phosphate acetyltransferase [Luteibacter aegosomatis]|uniref:bifunctional enoyl-CoA hydratase/phosphate acetyltransferase n=1 Tax=Luteibacter aegosomatis TaxID=2911537 RepID=UPI001FF74D10|nr:bifunctional enoyl-CoA hydratase/phosphate acetyltransferase [Luteibacter aegosomatis]UPG83853.1 bifunctional enoyl-CoA hydratase/phosphate acetyltransferase [Luteibacter aegosomatis]